MNNQTYQFPDENEFRQMIADILDELPEAFFKGLNAGVNLFSEIERSPHGDDLIIMGQYCMSSLGKMIKIYYGSFKYICYGYDEDAIKQRLLEVIRHEFRHHLETMGGENSLVLEDEENLRAYLSRKESE